MALQFICDGMLGKLCKLLRMIGVDCTYSNEGVGILITARKEGRVILTRNTRLRDKENVFFIEATASSKQLQEVVDTHGLWDEIEPFSRCVVCNEKLNKVSRESIRNKVPYFTFKHFDEYAQCPKCSRVYWKGSHYKKMMCEIETILDVKLGDS